NRLHAVIVGSDAVDKVQSAGSIAMVEGFDPAGWLEFFGVRPIGLFLLHLAVGIATALQRLERLLQGLWNVPFIDQPPPQIDDLVDVLNQQRTFRFTSAAGGARPDLILGINASGIF